MGLILIIASIKEGLSFLGMPMQINNEFDNFLFGKFKYLIFYVVNFRIKLLNGFIPASVEVSTNERTTVIPMDDAVRVYHRKDLEDKLIAENSGFELIGKDEIEKEVQDPAGNGLSWM